MTGMTRSNSTSSGTGSEPGRVDSPPTSVESAPSSTIDKPRATAASSCTNLPPSEKESGVTLRTPIICVRADKSYLAEPNVYSMIAVRIVRNWESDNKKGYPEDTPEAGLLCGRFCLGAHHFPLRLDALDILPVFLLGIPSFLIHVTP